MRRFASLSAPALLLATVAGCGDVASPGYGGESLAVIHGRLDSQLPTPLPEVDIVIALPDASKGTATSAPFSTFVRLPVAATLPARFSASIFEPPPETAYLPLADGYPRLVGPRSTDALILLVRRDRELTTTMDPTLDTIVFDPNEAVLTLFDEYKLTYYEADGKLASEAADGTLTDIPGGQVTKGFHLMRWKTTTCAESFDEACIAANLQRGVPEGLAWQTCVTFRPGGDPYEVPLDTEISLTVRDPSGAEPRPPLCTTPPPG
jgi:hypothetical protein